MTKYIQHVITASIPDGDDEIAFKAIAATLEPANAVVKELTDLGLADAKRTSRLFTKMGTRGKRNQPKVYAAGNGPDHAPASEQVHKPV